jgi:hypothetical protein
MIDHDPMGGKLKRITSYVEIDRCRLLSCHIIDDIHPIAIVHAHTPTQDMSRSLFYSRTYECMGAICNINDHVSNMKFVKHESN